MSQWHFPIVALVLLKPVCIVSIISEYSSVPAFLCAHALRHKTRTPTNFQLTHDPSENAVRCLSCHHNTVILQQLSQGLGGRGKSTHPETTIRRTRDSDKRSSAAATHHTHHTHNAVILPPVCDQKSLRSHRAFLSCDSPHSAYRCVDLQTPDIHSSSTSSSALTGLVRTRAKPHGKLSF